MVERINALNRFDHIKTKIISSYYNHREVVIWGAGDNLMGTIDMLTRSGISHGLVVDTYKAIQGRYAHPDCLNGKSDKYYVVVSTIKEYPEIHGKLALYGYTKNIDYCYITNEYFTVPKDYEDEDGNRVIGDFGEGRINFQGSNSIIEVGEGFKGYNLKLILGSNCFVKIGNNVIADNSVWELADGADLEISDEARWRGSYGRPGYHVVSVCRNAICKIGKNTSFGYETYIQVSPDGLLTVGNDCLFANQNYFRTDDGHFIYDLETGKCKEEYDDRNRSIIIGDHVWSGYQAVYLYSTVIGSGSIVGSRSLVKGEFPNNCIIAGSPAIMIKSNIAWSKDEISEMSMIPENYRQFTKLDI